MFACIRLVWLLWARFALHFSFNTCRQYGPSLRGPKLETCHPCRQSSSLLRAQPKLSCCNVCETQQTASRVPRDHSAFESFVLHLAVHRKLRVGQCIVVGQGCSPLVGSREFGGSSPGEGEPGIPRTIGIG